MTRQTSRSRSITELAQQHTWHTEPCSPLHHTAQGAGPTPHHACHPHARTAHMCVLLPRPRRVNKHGALAHAVEHAGGQHGTQNEVQRQRRRLGLVPYKQLVYLESRDMGRTPGMSMGVSKGPWLA